MSLKPSTQERIWAALVHLSALAIGFGLLLPLIGWSENRRKSRYAAFQSLQALGYQTLGYTVWLILTFVIVAASSVGFLAGVQNIASLEADLNAWTATYSLFLFGLTALYLAPPILAAVACALGMDFRYPLLGRRLARYVGYEATAEGEWLNEEHEDRWVASMGHFAILIVLWGLLAPITAWALHGKRSPFLKFQSAQTLVYQAATSLLYFAAGFFYVFGLIVFVLTIGFEGDAALDSSGAMMGVIVFLVSLLISLLVVLIVPLLHILGQWAGYRVLKGDDYHYPLVGRLVKRWLAKKTPPA
jgi:uncharacterized Tic20 family protein